MKTFTYTVEVCQLQDFTDIIDVRSPAEFVLDHIPGAQNYPVMSDEERAQVGTLYKTSPFEARKIGAALVCTNMAHILQTKLADQGKNWKPLVYCWRGGMRSGAAAMILSQIGWHAYQLKGGYKAYRGLVMSQLEDLASSFHFKVVCGPTGSGKSRFLKTLEEQGFQVLDLEELAVHRGSIFGLLPGDTQPSQRFFETRLWEKLRTFDPAKPIFVEAESRRIGLVSLPAKLYQQMHAGECIELDVPLAERIRFLCEDYDFYLKDVKLLQSKLLSLSHLRSKQEIERWLEMVAVGDFRSLVEQLLSIHYDPLYWRSMKNHYPLLASAQTIHIAQLDAASLACAAKRL